MTTAKLFKAVLKKLLKGTRGLVEGVVGAVTPFNGFYVHRFSQIKNIRHHFGVYAKFKLF